MKVATKKKYIATIKKANYTLNIFVSEIADDERIYMEKAKSLVALMYK